MNDQHHTTDDSIESRPATSLHQAADLNRWCGRDDSHEGPAGRRWHQAVRALDAAQTPGSSRSVAILGLQSDEGVKRNLGRVGAAQGPQAIRAQLSNQPLRQCQQIYDGGDILCPATSSDGDNLSQAQNQFADHLAQILHQGYPAIALGGGHEIAYASFRGLAQHLQRTSLGHHTPTRIGVINFDAHLDLRQASQPSSGTPFRQIAEYCAQNNWPFHYYCLGVSEFANTQALFQRAQRLGVRWQRDDQMHQQQLPQIRTQLAQFIEQADHLYLTICLDVFPAAFAPGVSAPAALGVDPGIVEQFIDQIIASGKLRLSDIAEMNPHYDQDHRTARLAARFVARIANGICASR